MPHGGNNVESGPGPVIVVTRGSFATHHHRITNRIESIESIRFGTELFGAGGQTSAEERAKKRGGRIAHHSERQFTIITSLISQSASQP